MNVLNALTYGFTVALLMRVMAGDIGFLPAVPARYNFIIYGFLIGQVIAILWKWRHPA